VGVAEGWKRGGRKKSDEEREDVGDVVGDRQPDRMLLLLCSMKEGKRMRRMD
jgi:hypothetical protein